MVCPFCLHDKTEVYNSRTTKKRNNVWRRRRCKHCGKEFTTNETVDISTVIRVEGQSFSHGKLLLSLFAACDHRKDRDMAATYLTQTVEQSLYPLAARHGQTIRKHIIAEQVLSVLKNYDAAAYVKYLSYHSSHLDARSIKRRLEATS